MQLELKKVSLEGFRLILDRLLIQEDTQEGIVPDTLPDIVRIVDASGQVFLSAKEALEGTLRISGTIRATILYIPESEMGIRRMEVNIPIVCMLDDPGVKSSCRLWAGLQMAGIDVQMINPRKVLVRAETAAYIRVFAAEEQKICSEILGGEKRIQQRIESCRSCVIGRVEEKSFNFSDTLPLSASKPRAMEILRSRVEPGNIEAKIIGGKLILKGEVELVLLYQSENEPIVTRFILPYSQIIDVGDGAEEGEPVLSSAVTEFECDLIQGDPGSVSVKYGMMIQAAVIKKQDVLLVADAYSTESPVETENGKCSLCVEFCEEKKRESVRRFCECALPAKSVIDSVVSVGRVHFEKAEDKNVIRADAVVRILYLSEDNELCSGVYLLPAFCDCHYGEDKRPACSCAPKGEVTAVPVTGGLEVRFDVEFSVLSVLDTSVDFVAGFKELPISEEGKDKPSVVLRKMAEGELLWDIAKTYQSTIEEIKLANEIESESDLSGKMLLIPRWR